MIQECCHLAQNDNTQRKDYSIITARNPSVKRTPGLRPSHMGKPLLLIIIAALLGPVIARGQDIENLKDAKPFEIKGSLSATAIYFDANGRKSSRQPFTWLLQGNPILYLYGIAFPVNIVVSEQERDFRQPFNRFGISPTYKWIRLHAGYQNLSFSTYSLAGHAMTGAGVELTPGRFRFAYMHGRLLRAVNSPRFVEDQDYRVQPSFTRVGDALKIGYGTQSNFIDLAILKARDIISSIDSIPENSSLAPAENLVVAVRTEQLFLKKFRFAFEYARSIYTNDTRAENSTNSSLISPLNLLLDEKTSTASTSALEARLRYDGTVFFAGISFQRIDPNYRSMGAYFFLNDIQKITVDPGVNLFNNRLRIATSYGYQENNLADTKSLKTIRKVGSVNITARLGNLYQFNGNYSNFGVGQKEGFEVTDPAQQITQVTQNWSMNHSFSLQRQNSVHNLNLMVNYQDLNDKNKNTAAFSNYSSGTYSGNYILSLLPVLFSINAGYIFTTYTLGQQDIRYHGPSINLNKSFFKNKLQVMVSANRFTNTMDSMVTRKLSRYSLRVGYKMTQKQRITLKTYLNEGKTPDDAEKNYTETKVELNYAYHF